MSEFKSKCELLYGRHRKAEHHMLYHISSLAFLEAHFPFGLSNRHSKFMIAIILSTFYLNVYFLTLKVETGLCRKFGKFRKKFNIITNSFTKICLLNPSRQMNILKIRILFHAFIVRLWEFSHESNSTL